MTCYPSQSAPRADLPEARERIRTRALALLGQNPADPALTPRPADAASAEAALATGMMDLYRRTGDAEVFDCLVKWVGPQLLMRIRSRLRGMGAMFDAQEILQDTIVNIYRYPDRFLASRAGAFAAWSSTIVDNAIRRHMRRQRQGPDVALSAPEFLQEQADVGAREPSLAVQEREECSATANAFSLLLSCYLTAFQTLSERERFVLQMVEVRCMRYAALAAVLAIRPEALKMIVFRARKRIFDRTSQLLGTRDRLAAVAAGGPRPGVSALVAFG